MYQCAASVQPVCGQCAASVLPVCGQCVAKPKSGFLWNTCFLVKAFGSEFYYKNIQIIDMNIIAEKYQTNQKVEMQNHHNR